MSRLNQWTEEELQWVKEAYELNEKGRYGANTKKLSRSKLAELLSSEDRFSERTNEAVKRRLKLYENKLAAEAGSKNPPQYKDKDETGHHDGDWNAGYKLGAFDALLTAGPSGRLTLLEIKSAMVKSLPKDHDFVFDNKALINAVNTAIYLGQIEMVRRGNKPALFKLKEEFIRKRNKVLKELGRESECTMVGGKGS